MQKPLVPEGQPRNITDPQPIVLEMQRHPSADDEVFRLLVLTGSSTRAPMVFELPLLSQPNLFDLSRQPILMINPHFMPTRSRETNFPLNPTLTRILLEPLIVDVEPTRSEQ